MLSANGRGRAFSIVAFVVSLIYIESCMVLLKRIVEGEDLLCNNIITFRVFHFAFYILESELYVKDIRNISL